MAKRFSAISVAAALGVSVNTVYRAINHTGQVKSATQRRILAYIQENYPDLPAESTDSNAKIIAVISQTKPEYYWQASIEEMRQALEVYPAGSLHLRSIFYTGLRNEPDLLDAIAHLDTASTDALIVTPVCSERSYRAIARLAEQIPVVVFNEYGNFGSSFLAHGDGRAEGTEAAELVALSRAVDKRVLILRSIWGSHLIEERIAGFRTRLAQRPDCVVLGELDISETLCGEYNYNTTMSAQLARQLSDYFHQHPDANLTCIYIADGLIAPLCAALVKLGRTDIRCFGHECNDNVRRFFSSTIRGGYVRSDIRAQSRAAIETLATRLVNASPPESGETEFITPFDSCLIEE